MATMDTGWVLFKLEKQQFGMPIKDLLQMVVLEKVSTQATAPDEIRGLIQLRDRIVPVVDTRKCLGMTPKQVQFMAFIDMMCARKQDHIHWLDELILSVDENRPFTLAKDPHQCAFGKWYDNYHTDNAVFSMHLAKFDRPHRRIHEIAGTVETLVKSGDVVAARELIAHTRETELKTMITLFDGVEEVLKTAEKEIVLVMNFENRLLGFIVDDVHTVRDIAADAVQRVDNIGTVSVKGGTQVAEVDGITSILLHPDDVFNTTV